MLRFRLVAFAVIAALAVCQDAYAKDKSEVSPKEKTKKSSSKKDKDRDKEKESASDDGDESNTRKNAEKSSEPRAETKSESKQDAKSSNDVSELIEKLDYPELQVVPRASERLRMEAQEERNSWAWTHWQIELAGFATAVTATTGKNALRKDLSASEESDANQIMAAGTGVGIAWVASGILIGLQRPYRSGMNLISKYDGKDMRSMIMRERLAEEALERPTHLIRPLRWVAALSNFGLNVAMAYYLTDKARITAGVSALLAFMPLMYDDRHIRVYEKHLEYKSKIYGPITSFSPVFDPHSGKMTPVARLTWNF